MADPRRVGAMGWRAVWWPAWLLCLGLAAQAQVTIVVDTNLDLADPGDNRTSLREAISQANARPASDGDVLITFDPNVFQPNPGTGWSHGGGLYYDEPDLAAPTNDPNRIIVGAPELATRPGYVTDMGGLPAPLPAITRSHVRIDGELDNNGFADVRIDLFEIMYLWVPFMSPERSHGIKVTAAEDVVIEGLDIRFAQPNPGEVRASVPAVWFAGGTNHRLINSDVSQCIIGVETNVAAGNQVFIGGISVGSGNNLTNCQFAAVYCVGAGTTNIQANTINNNGNPANSDSGADYSGGVVFEGSGSNNLGGTVAGAANTIANNMTHGVVIAGSGQNVVTQNSITGSRRSGIHLVGSGANIIGGSASLSGNTIGGNGLVAGGWNHSGIHILGSGANVIQGNRIGLGNGNGGAGIHIASDGANRIGGPATDARNIISQNGALGSSESKAGIRIQGHGSNVIENNYIGTDAAGTGRQPNVGHGIEIEGNGANLIGGTQIASRNVISGNQLNGIRLAGAGDNIITGNYIGPNANGGGGVGNGNNGMEITATAGGANRIGGTSAAERNVISGNSVDGVTVNGTGNNQFYGNWVGLAADGTSALANSRHGISLTVQAIGRNTIGGRAPGQRNIISGNGQFGISLEGDAEGDSNLIQGNYVGPTANAANARANGAGGIGVNAARPQTIGGSALGDGNIVAGNRANAASDGIELLGTGAHVVMGNLIGAVPANPGGYPQDARLTATADFRNGGSGILIGGGATGAIELGRPGANEANVIVNNDAEGIQIAGSGNVRVLHNFVGCGLDASNQLAAMPNQGDGILISGSGGNTIGGYDDNDPDTTHLNVISGNLQNGISITGPGHNQVLRNIIGADVTATQPLPNGDSTAAAASDNGVAVTGSGNNLLAQNTISGNTNHGVYLFGTGTYTLLGNSIGLTGLDRTGNVALGNGGHGIYAPDNAPGVLVLGGGGPTELNVISGNGGDGVRLEGNVTNTLQQNRIGTNGAGTAAVANGECGVHLVGTSSTITTVLDNTISGNTDAGVTLVSGQNTLYRNRIGTDATGSQAVPNGGHGILINDPNLPTVRQGQVIGRVDGPNVLPNIISGNRGDGIHVVQAGGDDSGGLHDDILIHANLIGTDSTGAQPLANGGDGIAIAPTCTGRIWIGGTGDSQGNLISGNAGWGVRFEGAYSYNPDLAVNNRPVLFGNQIGTNRQGDQAVANGAGGVLLNVPLGSPARTVLLGEGLPGIEGQFVGGRPSPSANVFQAANQIAGNTGDGVRIDGSAHVTVLGNYLGTDSYGRKDLPNTGDGIRILSSSTGEIRIGVYALDPAVQNDLEDFEPPVGNLAVKPQYRNLIAGNGGFGINGQGSGAITVANNFLGAREVLDGALWMPDFFTTGGANQAGGVRIASGGSAPALVAFNAIFRGGSAGTTPGVVLATGAPVTVRNNRIEQSRGAGLELNGTGAFVVTDNILAGNGGDGIRISQASGARIGSAAMDAATVTGQNLIRQNGGNGISVVTGSGNLLNGNLIFDNGVVNNVYNGSSLAIDLGAASGAGPDGVSLNDGQTSSGAPNLLLDYPVLDRLVADDPAQTDANQTAWTVSGAVPAGPVTVQLYQAGDLELTSPDPDPLRHHGQLAGFLTRVQTSDGRFSVNLPAGSFAPNTPVAELLLCAVVSDASGNTSEVSRNTGTVSLAQSTLEINPEAIPTDGSAAARATATATVRDVIGTPLPGVPDVLIAIKNPVPQPDGVVLEQAAQTTDDQGRVTANLTAAADLDCADTAANRLTLGATVAGQSLNDVTLGLEVGAASTTRSTITASPDSNVIADGASTATLTVTVRDNSGTGGCAVTDVAVQVFEVQTGAPVIPASTPLTITGPANRTNNAGLTTATVAASRSGSYQFGFAVDRDNNGEFAESERVRDDQGALRTVTVTFIAGAVDAEGSTLTADPREVQANGSDPATLTLTLRDAQGNPLVGVASGDVSFTAGPADGVSIGAASGATDAAGKLSVPVTSSRPGSVTFVATVRGTVINQTALVTFGVGGPSSASSLVATPLEARPNGVDKITLVATMLDDSTPPNPLENREVTFTTLTGSGIVFGEAGEAQPAVKQTNATGVASTTVRATAAGTATFQASALVDGATVVLGTAQVTFRLLDPDAARSTVAVTTDDPLLANGRKAATVTVRLVDGAGDPLPGVLPDEFTIRCEPATAQVTGPLGATGAQGETTFTITSTVAGPVTATIVARGVTLDATAQATFLPSISQSYGAGLQMIGIAGTAAEPDPRNVLSSLLPGLQLARWDAPVQNYRVWEEFSPTAPFAMRAGRGFWLQLAAPLSFTLVAEPTPAAPFEMALARGWNQVANPWPSTWSFQLSQVLVRQNGTAVGTLETEAARALVTPYLWRWDPVLQYLLVLDPGTAGAPAVSGNVGLGQGFWWLCRGDGVTVELQPPTAGRAVTRQATPTPGSWLAALEVSTASGAAQAVFGAGSSRLRADLPPAAPVTAPVEVAFVDGGRAASDIRQGPLTSRQQWTVEVTSREAGPVTVAWQGLGRALPAGHKLWLSDPTSGQRVLMNSRASYGYTGEAGVRQLVLELDPRGERRLEIAAVQTGTSRSRAAGVPVNVTLTAPARVTVTVRGLGGRLVRQYSVAGEAGLNAVAWDGRDQSGRPVPAGSYQVEVVADSDDGEVARAVRTIAVR